MIQVDRDLEAIGAHRPVDLGVVGDARATAEALLEALGDARGSAYEASRRSIALAAEIAGSRWRDEPYDGEPRPGSTRAR